MAMRNLVSLMSASRNYSTESSGNRKNWMNYKFVLKNSPKASKPRIIWTEEQSRVISAVSSGKSVFLTGSAGTGKTFLIEHVKKLLKKSFGRSKVYVTASTGIAACVLKGQTLHCFAGIKYTEVDRMSFLAGIESDRKAIYRWRKARALVIDEISMIDGKLFDNLDYAAREIRDVDEPWGGIQLVVSGDFLQLPPVSVKNHKQSFAFEADCWNSSFDLQIELTKVFRQSDERLVRLLQAIRRGEVEPEDLQYLEKHCSAVEPDDSVVRLFPTNDDVKFVNQVRIDELGKNGFEFLAVDFGEDRWKRQLKYGMAPDEIILCEGARVMLLKNKDTWRGLMNGATGTVIGFVEPEDMDVSDVSSDGVLPLVKFDFGSTVLVEPQIWCVMDGDVVVARRKQIPLMLAWALSIHKCQGMTLDRLHTIYPKLLATE